MFMCYTTKKKFILLFVLTFLCLLFYIRLSSSSRNDDPVQKKEFLIEPLNETCTGGVLFLVLVTSYVGHVELRSAHRRAMSVRLLERYNARRIFLLSRIPQNEKYITQEQIHDESNIYGDILQGKFIENYRNLTLKHLMGLQWASTECNQSPFILKVDDDTVFNLIRTYHMIMSLKNLEKQEFLMGYMLNNTKPKRLMQDKWYVTQKEYSKTVYPSYLSGWYYITTQPTASNIYKEALLHPSFWIDDVFITGIIAEALNIKLYQLPSGYWLEYYELLECCLKDMITKFVSCDYVVGPNGGRNDLIVEANKAWDKCYVTKNCTVRPSSQDLNKVCVAFRQRTIFSSGKGMVESINS